MDGPVIRLTAIGFWAAAFLHRYVLRDRRRLRPSPGIRPRRVSRPGHAHARPHHPSQARPTAGDARAPRGEKPAARAAEPSADLPGIDPPDGRTTPPAPRTPAAERSRCIRRPSARSFPGPCRLP